jgi:hypothetical protein
MSDKPAEQVISTGKACDLYNFLVLLSLAP